MTDNGALIFANPSNMTFTGAIGGNGQLAKTGAGLMVLSASETYTGSTSVSTGTLQVNYPLATSGIALSNSGVFAANIANAWTLTMANFISGTGSVVKSGVGTLTLEAANNVHVENSAHSSARMSVCVSRARADAAAWWKKSTFPICT